MKLHEQRCLGSCRLGSCQGRTEGMEQTGRHGTNLLLDGCQDGSVARCQLLHYMHWPLERFTAIPLCQVLCAKGMSSDQLPAGRDNRSTNQWIVQQSS